MQAHVIPFPTGAQRAAEGDLRGDPEVVLLPDSVVQVAAVRAELRRLPGIDGSSVALPIDRCVRAALRALAHTASALEVSGTEMHPVIGATLRGPGSRAAAARAAQVAAEAVRRAGDGRMILSAGVAEGWTGVTPDGVRAVVGDPVQVAAHLVERAAPGQVLLGGDGWTAIERVRTHPAVGDTTDPVPVYVLRDVR